MKRPAIIIVMMLLCALVQAQTWEEIRTSQLYLSGEGKGETIDEADKHALAALISKITVEVSSSIEVSMEETREGDTWNSKSYAENKVKTYSNATLNNTDQLILSNEPDAHVGRWIKRSEIDRIFAGRRAKVMEYVGNAEKGVIG